MTIHWRCLLLCASLLFSLPAVAGSPQWLRDAARATLPAYPADVRGVEIYAEQITRVMDSGEIRTTYRHAFKILSTKGRDLGRVVVYFDKETKLSSLMAWTIPAKGSEYEVKEKDALETMMYNDSLYEDTRYKILRLPEAEPGAVVGWEYEQRHRPYALEDVWSFQGDVPSRKVRYTLILPAGWEMKTHWRNHPGQEPQIAGGQYTWELNDVPEIKDEPGMPTTRAVAGRLSVVLIPPSGVRGNTHGNWNDVAQWFTQLATGRRQSSAEIKRKTTELTASSPGLLEKMRALGTFAQRDIRYVAIEIGIGGYQPHFAQETFLNRYGDCKDKVTLLSTMLKEVGIESYYVVVHTSRGFVAPDFASMNSFNHMVLAIRIPEDLKAEGLHSVVRHPTLGRLLIFDPTDSLTPVGYLPPHLQSNHGLLVIDKGGEIIALPMQPPDANQLQRTATLKLERDGTLSGDVREVRSGTNAVEYRSELMAMPKPQRLQKMESFLSTFLSSFSLVDYQVENLEEFNKELVVRYSFVAKNYAKSAGPLLLLRPRVFGSKADRILDLKERKYPLEIEAPTLHTDEFRITLPDGMIAEELPPVVNATSGAVTYKSASTFEGKVLQYKRTYQIDQVRVPLPNMEDWNKVNRRILQDERSSAVLKNTP